MHFKYIALLATTILSFTSTFGTSVASTSPLIGAWHCDYPGAGNSEASSAQEYVFNANNVGTLGSDKGPARIIYHYKGGILDVTVISSLPHAMTFINRSKITFHSNNMIMISLGSLQDNVFHPNTSPTKDRTMICTRVKRLAR